jgi:hypothetical protein
LRRSQAGGPEDCHIVGQTTAPVVGVKGLSINPHRSRADGLVLSGLHQAQMAAGAANGGRIGRQVARCCRCWCFAPV